MPKGGISPGTAQRVHRISASHSSSLSSQMLGWHADGYAIRWRTSLNFTIGTDPRTSLRPAVLSAASKADHMTASDRLRVAQRVTAKSAPDRASR